MSMPTEPELAEALAEAGRMRERREDPYHVAKALLNCHYRLGLLEEVMHAAERLLHSGMDATEHARLDLAIRRAREGIDRSAGRERDSLGL